MFDVDANGLKIPALGYGTYRIEGRGARRIVETALEVGYRHVDTAQIYGNEAEVGAAIAASGLARPEIFLTTKVWPSNFGRRAFMPSVEESLRKLQVDQVDLLLLHWPVFETSLRAVMDLLVEARERGYTRGIGVSNFNRSQLAEAFDVSGASLATNQVEYHPFLDQTAMLERLRAKEMALTAYSPLARGDIGRAGVLAAIAERHGRTPGQIALRWLVQQPGVVAIPKTADEGRMRANLDVFSFSLDDDEMRQVSDLGSPAGRQTAPAGLAPDWEG